MSFLIMSEREFRLLEATRLQWPPALRWAVALAAAVFPGGCLIAVDWVDAGSLAGAWQTIGPAALAISGSLFALVAGGFLVEDWRYRRTRALSADVRGFGIEPLTEAGYREFLAAERDAHMNAARQREWESIRARGLFRFAIWGIPMGILTACGMVGIVWIMPGPRYVDVAGNAWEDLGWMLAFPTVFVAMFIGLWFLNEWSYRRGKAKTSG